MYSFENNMPRWLQRKAYVRRAVIKPNTQRFAAWHRVSSLIFKGQMWETRPDPGQMWIALKNCGKHDRTQIEVLNSGHQNGQKCKF